MSTFRVWLDYTTAVLVVAENCDIAIMRARINVWRLTGKLARPVKVEAVKEAV